MNREVMKFISDSYGDYRKFQNELKESQRVSPKQYGEHLQKKRKRGKRK